MLPKVKLTIKDQFYELCCTNFHDCFEIDNEFGFYIRKDNYKCEFSNDLLCRQYYLINYNLKEYELIKANINNKIWAIQNLQNENDFIKRTAYLITIGALTDDTIQ